MPRAFPLAETDLRDNRSQVDLQPVRSVRVVVPCGPLAPHARLLARCLDYSLEEVSDSIKSRVGELLQKHSSDIAVVLSSDAATDRLLHSWLSSWQARAESREEWDRIPGFSLLTGRGIDGVARTVEKAIAARGRRRSGSSHFCHLRSRVDHVRQIVLRFAGDARASIERRRLTEGRLETELRRPLDALAVDTHGVESCGQADDHIVLCGRQDSMDSTTGRDLACGCGFQCPRGDRPIPLRDLGARVALIASCSSLRLGDSAIEPAFNLGLSYLDGPGEAYAGSIMPNGGNRVAARAFLAALASGYTLSQATSLVNAHVCAAGLDSANLVTVGTPDLRVLHAETEEEDLHKRSATGGMAVSFGAARVSALRVTTPWILDLARLKRLALEISAEVDGAATTYFYRLEGYDAETALRLFLFRFPEQLGDLHLRFFDARQVDQATRAKEDQVKKWWRLAQLTELPEERRRALEEIPALTESACMGLERTLPGLRYDGSARGRVRKIATLLGSTEEALRNELLMEIVPKLGDAFWLSNLFGSVQRLISSEVISCPYCDGLATHKILKDNVTRSARSVEVCGRCSILSDITDGGPLRSVRLRCPHSVLLNTSLRVRVDMERNPDHPESAVEIFVRLSTPRLGAVDPAPPGLKTNLDNDGPTSAGFAFDLPERLLPHYYFVKVLISSPGHLAFASRRLFLRQPAYRTPPPITS